MEEDARGSLRETRLREEVAGWVREVLKRVEDREGGLREEGGALRRLVRRRSKRETRAVWSEIRHGALRRSNSLEHLDEQVVIHICISTTLTISTTIFPITITRHHHDQWLTPLFSG